MKNITEVFNEHNDKLTNKWVHYFEIYERHFSKFIDKPVRLLEIGVEQGGSLQVWKKYFGKECEIVGIDINENSKFEESQIKVEIGSQNDISFLEKINQEYGPFDIIIDDGSHFQTDILTTFSFLYPKLNPGGVYFVEDLQTSYFRGYGGGVASPFNFVSISSRLVHDLNTLFMKEPYTSTLMNIKSINFYSAVVVFEKGDGEEIYSTYMGKDQGENIQYTPETLKNTH